MSATLQPSERTRLRRLPDRGSYERETIHAILDEGLVCHLSFAASGQPHVIPTIYARRGDTVFLHGSAASRTLRALKDGAEACMCVTLVDGLVLARAAFHTSINFRSVILYGKTREVSDAAEKLEALEALVEHAVPGRWKDVRGPNESEFRQTSVLALPIDEASAKVREGGPKEEPEDYAIPCWAGVIPLRQTTLPLVADDRLADGIVPPPYVQAYHRPGTTPEGHA